MKKAVGSVLLVAGYDRKTSLGGMVENFPPENPVKYDMLLRGFGVYESDCGCAPHRFSSPLYYGLGTPISKAILFDVVYREKLEERGPRVSSIESKLNGLERAMQIGTDVESHECLCMCGEDHWISNNGGLL